MGITFLHQQELLNPCLSHWQQVRTGSFHFSAGRFLHFCCCSFYKNSWGLPGKKKNNRGHACLYTACERTYLCLCKHFGVLDLTLTDLANYILIYTHTRPAGQATSCSTCSTKTLSSINRQKSNKQEHSKSKKKHWSANQNHTRDTRY